MSPTSFHKATHDWCSALRPSKHVNPLPPSSLKLLPQNLIWLQSLWKCLQWRELLLKRMLSWDWVNHVSLDRKMLYHSHAPRFVLGRQVNTVLILINTEQASSYHLHASDNERQHSYSKTFLKRKSVNWQPINRCKTRLYSFIPVCFKVVSALLLDS